MSQQINLANPQLLKKRYVFGLREMLVGIGVVLAGGLAWAGFLHYQASAVEMQAAQQEALQVSAQAELDGLSAAANRSVSSVMTERIKKTQTQVAQRETLLASIGGTIDHASTGFSPRLRALALSTTEGVWLNSFNLSAGHVELTGSAFNAELLTAYLDRLGQQASFAGLKFSGLTAVQANAASDSKPTEVAQPEYLDFVLSAGGPASPSDQGKSDGQ